MRLFTLSALRAHEEKSESIEDSAQSHLRNFSSNDVKIYVYVSSR